MIKNESGRSMVEMLGVLAIIGVLSVGGIAGYTMAMNKYKANEIVSAASLTLVECETQGTTANNKTYANLFSGATAPTGATITCANTSGTASVTIDVTDSNLCSALKEVTLPTGIAIDSSDCTS